MLTYNMIRQGMGWFVTITFTLSPKQWTVVSGFHVKEKRRKKYFNVQDAT